MNPWLRDEPLYKARRVLQKVLQNGVVAQIASSLISPRSSPLKILQMPHKFDADPGDKFPKKKYQVTNWSEENQCLRQRGDVTFWISEGALDRWSALHFRE